MEVSTKELRRIANRAAREASLALERAARASLNHRNAKEAIERRALSAASSDGKNRIGNCCS